jgi:hypothetical protein
MKKVLQIYLFLLPVTVAVAAIVPLLWVWSMISYRSWINPVLSMGLAWVALRFTFTTARMLVMEVDINGN